MNDETRGVLELAVRLAREAGAIQRERWRTRPSIRTKSTATDLVTEVDHACERLVVEALRRERPGDAIVAEEGSGEDLPGARFRWIIDPLDGTVNFAHGYPRFCVSIGVEREITPGFFIGADYIHQHWSDLYRTVDINAPAPFDRTASGQTRSASAANATRPIPSVNGGVDAVNVLMNLGVADYDGLTALVRYRANAKLFASLSYTLSKATNTTEPDGNGIAA